MGLFWAIQVYLINIIERKPRAGPEQVQWGESRRAGESRIQAEQEWSEDRSQVSGRESAHKTTGLGGVQYDKITKCKG